MKALSLTQPWAQLVALGGKSWETRDWSAAYRGPLFIHASKAYPPSAREFAQWSPAKEWLRGFGITEVMPTGCIVAMCRLSEVVRTEDVRESLGPEELAFGDYGDGRFAWRLEDVDLVYPVVPCRGALGLWEYGEPVRAR